jgi:O-methyltransferase
MGLKTAALSIPSGILRRLGYGVYRIGEKGQYTLNLPNEYATYSPWFEDWFQEIYGGVQDHTLLKADMCYVVYQFCRHCLHANGDFAECGVYKGGSAFLIASMMSKRLVEGRLLHLFDTFAGYPAAANADPSPVQEGSYGDTSLTKVKDYLKAFPFIAFHPGLIPETLEPVQDRRFAFVYIDVDLYQTTRDCLDFFYSRMVTGGVMLFGDYGFALFADSEKRAVDEFFADKPECPIALHTGQCMVVRV